METKPDDPQTPVTNGAPSAPQAPKIEPVTSVQPAEPESAPAQAAPTRPGLVRRFFHWLLGKDTPVGRVVRLILVRLLIALLLVGAGLLIGFFWLVQPATQALTTSQDKLFQRNALYATQEARASNLQLSLDAAQKRITALTDEVRAAQNRANLLVLINDVATARMHLARKDGPKTLESINQAQVDLANVMAFLTEKDAKAASEIKSRLELIPNVLVRDAQLAQSDLDNLYAALLAIQDSIFKK